MEHTPALNIENIKSVYVGQSGKCCCGCAGMHTYNTEGNEEAIRRVIRNIECNIEDAEECEDHIFVEIDGRLFIAYFNGAAQKSEQEIFLEKMGAA